jgi:excinuclease ABC subunit B
VISTRTRASTRVADAKTPKEVKVAERRAGYALDNGGKDPEVVMLELETEMRDAAAQLDFERAALLRDQLLEVRAQMDGTKGSGTAARNMRAEPV